MARGARIGHDRKPVAAGTTADGAAARFADGSSLSGDLLTGCAGIRSRTRSVIGPAAPAARCLPLLNLGGFASDVDVPGDPARLRFIRSKGFLGSPLSGGHEVWWFAHLPRGTQPSRTEPAAMDRDMPTARLLATLADPPFGADLIRATYTDLYALPTRDLPTVATWPRERLVPSRGAAHATTPASASASASASGLVDGPGGRGGAGRVPA
ncbi:hypothetical protein [Streptomyces sp. NPDC002156]